MSGQQKAVEVDKVSTTAQLKQIALVSYAKVKSRDRAEIRYVTAEVGLNGILTTEMWSGKPDRTSGKYVSKAGVWMVAWRDIITELTFDPADFICCWSVEG